MNWTQTRITPHEKWESDCNNFDILHSKGRKFVLVSFIHEPIEYGQEFWTKQFKSLEEAMKYAEHM